MAAPYSPYIGIKNKFKQILSEKVIILLKFTSQFSFINANESALYSLRQIPNIPKERIIKKLTVLKIIEG